MPAGLPGYERVNAQSSTMGASMALRIPAAQLYLRLHELYMGMWFDHRRNASPDMSQK